jgi:steroid 5-alpha reductase family enzyme
MTSALLQGWWPTASASLNVIIVIAFIFWLISFFQRDVSVVDSAWSLLQLAAGLTYAATLPTVGARGWLCLSLIAVWAVRLSAYITWRNHGKPEDYRYREIRVRNEPYFAWKSLYLIFGLQGMLGWIISLPLLFAMRATTALTALDLLAAALFFFGFLFESIGDWQLARFQASAANRMRVLDSGLWRFTRHPNYFGEFCMAWAIYLFALGGGGGWTIFAPLLMTFLLLRVSGVALLEKDIGTRRPDYARYVATTRAFFPWWPRQHSE